MSVTPFQTIGPYFQVMLRDKPRGSDSLVTERTRGQRIAIEGVLYDGANAPVTDALIEIWQADSDGRYRHPEDPNGASADPAFEGCGRVATDDDGRFRFETVKPGVVAGPDGAPQAPHVLVSVLARGVLTRYWTRLYFEDELASNTKDAILQLVPAARRETLIAKKSGDDTYRLDLVIQGPRETVFFDA
jgi:protocatechuate 3,4-dioxygenase alpha subunit